MLEAEEEEEEDLDALQCLELFEVDAALGRAPVHSLAQHGELDAMAQALQVCTSNSIP